MASDSSMDWCCVAAVNKPEILEENLAASPVLKREPHRLSIFSDQLSASIAYNKGLDSTTARIVVFAHQDVYLPRGWENLLAQRVRELDAMDPQWAVAGVMGVKTDGSHFGRVWSTGLGLELGSEFESSVLTTSLDELLLIFNRNSGLRFDADLPSFHLYGTDLVQTASSNEKAAYIVHAPVVHNSKPVTTLKGGFDEAYGYLQKKWQHSLPIKTLVTEIATSNKPLLATQQRLRQKKWRQAAKKIIGLARKTDLSMKGMSAQSIAVNLGYENE